MAKKPAAAKKAGEKKPYRVVKKRSGRYMVIKKKGKYVNGEEKVKILLAEGLIKAMKPKAKPAAAE